MSHTAADISPRGHEACRPGLFDEHDLHCTHAEARLIPPAVCRRIKMVVYTLAMLPVVVPALVLIGATLTVERIAQGLGRALFSA